MNCWGAAAAAEASGLPWAVFAPYFLPIRGPGIPPWGLGLAPMGGLLGRARDAILWAVVHALYDRALPGLNELRVDAGVAPLRHVVDIAMRPHCLVCYTAEPFEYPRPWPDNVHLVGPALWEPPGDADPALPHDDRPLVLVTCSTEYQNDRRIVEAALEGLADEPVRIVATTAAIDPATFDVPANARVERYLPHGPLLREAACVVCHGGMGITQKALAAGVPVCVVPHGRDQPEVARHVEVARAGTRLPPKRLSPDRLRRAVREAMSRREGARRIAHAFARAGGPAAAADAIEGILVSRGAGVDVGASSPRPTAAPAPR